MPRSVWCGRQEWFQFSRQVRDALDNLPVRNGGATRRVTQPASGREPMLSAASCETVFMLSCPNLFSGPVICAIQKSSPCRDQV